MAVGTEQTQEFSYLDFSSNQYGVLELNSDEIICLVDRIKNSETGTIDMQISAYPLLLRLGSAFVAMVNPEAVRSTGTISIVVSLEEAWVLRSVISANDKTQNDSAFGTKLLLKIFTLLLSITAESVQEGFCDAPESAPDLLKEEVKKLLEHLPRENNPEEYL